MDRITLDSNGYIVPIVPPDPHQNCNKLKILMDHKDSPQKIDSTIHLMNKDWAANHKSTFGLKQNNKNEFLATNDKNFLVASSRNSQFPFLLKNSESLHSVDTIAGRPTKQLQLKEYANRPLEISATFRNRAEFV